MSARPGDSSASRPLRVLVLDGPNLNLLGTREPAIYGLETLHEINDALRARAASLGAVVAFFQSNHEGALIDRLQRRDFDAAIVNAGGLTHTSVSLRDALLAVERPFVEVHLSDPATREPFRRVNFLEDIAAARFVGLKSAGYHRALEELARRWDAGEIAARAVEPAEPGGPADGGAPPAGPPGA
jgi:3-dehydroquinate dehydratase-2